MHCLCSASEAKHTTHTFGFMTPQPVVGRGAGFVHVDGGRSGGYLLFYFYFIQISSSSVTLLLCYLSVNYN